VYYKERNMPKTYIGNKNLGRTQDGGYYVSVSSDREEEGRWLDPKESQDIINHSPDGFNWGYTGSGPAQLALSLLYDITKDKDLAFQYYHDLKFDIIARLDDKWLLEENQILHWLVKKQKRTY